MNSYWKIHTVGVKLNIEILCLNVSTSSQGLWEYLQLNGNKTAEHFKLYLMLSWRNVDELYCDHGLQQFNTSNKFQLMRHANEGYALIIGGESVQWKKLTKL